LLSAPFANLPGWFCHTPPENQLGPLDFHMARRQVDQQPQALLMRHGLENAPRGIPRAIPSPAAGSTWLQLAW